MKDAAAALPPLVEPDERSAPFYEAAARGVLRLHCERCFAWELPVRRRCPACGATALAWADASGRGTVWSHARALLPLDLVVVDLAEGVRMSARRAAGSPPLRVGDAVGAAFEPAGEGLALPVFRRA